MTLSRLLERAIITDLGKDQRIAEFPIQIHDNPGAKAGDTPTGGEPAKVVTTVSAKEASEIFGTGIKKMAVTVEIRSSLAADPNIGELLDGIEAAVSERLEPSYTAPLPDDTTGREDAFSGPQHKVFGITADGVSRSESNLERVREVKRTFIATMLSISSTPPTVATDPPRGIFNLNSNGFTQNVIAGVRARLNWSDIQPTDSTHYTWTQVDAFIASAVANNKQLGISVAACAAPATPQWLLDQGVSTYTLPETTNGNIFTIVLPWDPLVQAAWLAFCKALCQHVDGQVDYIAMGGLGDVIESFISGSPADISMSETAALAAWKASARAITDTHARYLTDTPFLFTADRPFHSSASGQALTDVVNALANKYPNRFGIMNSSLSAITTTDFLPANLIYTHTTTNPVGFQAVWSATNDPDNRVHGTLAEMLQAGIDCGAHFIEIYPADAADAPSASVILAAEATLGAPGF